MDAKDGSCFTRDEKKSYLKTLFDFSLSHVIDDQLLNRCLLKPFFDDEGNLDDTNAKDIIQEVLSEFDRGELVELYLTHCLGFYLDGIDAFLEVLREMLDFSCMEEITNVDDVVSFIWLQLKTETDSNVIWHIAKFIAIGLLPGNEIVFSISTLFSKCLEMLNEEEIVSLITLILDTMPIGTFDYAIRKLIIKVESYDNRKKVTKYLIDTSSSLMYVDKEVIKQMIFDGEFFLSLRRYLELIKPKGNIENSFFKEIAVNSNDPVIKFIYATINFKGSPDDLREVYNSTDNIFLRRYVDDMSHGLI